MTVVEEVKVTLVGKGDVLGFAECVLKTDDGVKVRLADICVKNVGGRAILIFPKKDRMKDYPYWNPVNRETSALLEDAILRPIQEALTPIKNFPAEAAE